MKPKDLHWISLSTTEQAFVCYRCNEKAAIKIPMPVTNFTKHMKAFLKLHEDCKETK